MNWVLRIIGHLMDGSMTSIYYMLMNMVVEDKKYCGKSIRWEWNAFKLKIGF